MIRYGNPVAEVGTGFGFLPGVVVDQHFHELRNRLARLQGVVAKHPEYLGMGNRRANRGHRPGTECHGARKRNVGMFYPTAEVAKPQVKVFASGAHIDLSEFHRLMNQPGKAGPRPMGKTIAQIGAKGGDPALANSHHGISPRG